MVFYSGKKWRSKKGPGRIQFDRLYAGGYRWTPWCVLRLRPTDVADDARSPLGTNSPGQLVWVIGQLGEVWGAVNVAEVATRFLSRAELQILLDRLTTRLRGTPIGERRAYKTVVRDIRPCPNSQ